ncbi:MAG: alpha/beta hydrolase [Gammaproteobacteria bacterium]
MTRTASERQKFLIPGPAGRLEAMLECPRDTAPRANAVVCHPHPLYQGTLNNKVAFTLARAAVEAGAAALRFNFRGVGASEGTWDGGHGEAEDLRAAEQWLANRFPGLQRWRLGFSFGAAMVIKVSLAEPCAILVTVAPPVKNFGDYGLPGGAPRAACWLLVQGDADEVVNPQTVFEWARGLEPVPELQVIAGAGHFFHGRLRELRERVLAVLVPGRTTEEKEN